MSDQWIAEQGSKRLEGCKVQNQEVGKEKKDDRKYRYMYSHTCVTKNKIHKIRTLHASEEMNEWLI